MFEGYIKKFAKKDLPEKLFSKTLSSRKKDFWI